MKLRKLKRFFNYNVFCFTLILLLAISFTFQNIAIAQNTNQQQPANSTEHLSLLLSLDNEGQATVNYSFQQNNLFAFVYGKSNIKVINLDTENIVYEVSCPESHFLSPYLVDNYLTYLSKRGKNYETIRVDLSTEGKESISFHGSSNQITDDGYLITYYGNLCQLIDLDVGQVIFEPDVSKGGRGKILCVDDLIIFPFSDSRGNNAGYKGMSTSGEVKFTLEEIYNEVRIFLPHYHSEISTFPIPILFCSNYDNPNEKQWLLKFIDKEGQILKSYSPSDLGVEYSYGYLGPTPLTVLDENQNKFLFRIRYHKKGESQRYYYILADSSGNILNIFDENVFDETNTSGFDHQGNILLFQNREGALRDVLNYYRQDGSLIFSKQIPSLIISRPGNFKLLGEDEILAWTYNKFEKYSLINGELTGIYPIPTDYKIYLNNTVTYNDEVYFFANSRGGFEPPIPGSNLFSFSAADSGWLDIELVSIRPNAGTAYEVWDNTEVKVKFRTEYNSSFNENLTVNFEEGELIKANNKNLEYTWHTPTIVSGSQTAKITVSYGPVSQEFVITIKDHIPTASFTFDPVLPQTGQIVHFDASLSVDLDGEISSYHWDFGDGTDEKEQEQDYIDHIFSTAGEYLVTLTVTDNNGQTNQISQNIKIAPCSYNLSKDNSHFSSYCGTGEFTVTSSNFDCQWTAVSDVHWIEVVSGGSGPGSKILSFSVQNNNSGEERTGHISIENEIYTITQKPKFELNLLNQGKTLTSNLSVFVSETEKGSEIDLDGDGINQQWEDKAMERISPYIELDEEEPWLMNQNIVNSIHSLMSTEISSFVGKVPQQILNSLTDHVANFVRIHPYSPGIGETDYHANQLPKYIIFRYVVTWSEDYGRFGFTAHKGDHERIFMAWRVIDNHTLDLDWVFTSAHRDPDIHHSVWSPYYRLCNKVDVATITENYDFSMLMYGKLDFDSQDGRLILCAAQGKHALYPTCNVCEDVLLVSTTLTGEDCCGGGRYLFDCYNVGEPDKWQYQDNEIYDLTVDKEKLGKELPQDDTDIFYNKLTSRYRITIKTGSKDYAGTDAKISIKLYGQDENSSNWFTIYSIGLPPRSAENVGTFEKGDLDHIFVSCTDLGSVNKIQVKHDNGGVGPGWYISEIWVEDLDTKTIWHCQPNTWLEKVFSPSLYSMGVWKDKTNKTFDLELE